MDINERIQLVKRNTAEVINEEHLPILLKRKKQPVTYCGYEVSGPLHLGHLVTITKLLDLQKAGCKVKILFADWHTWLNRKGDWKFIHDEIKRWKKGIVATGLKNAEFILGSSFQRKDSYLDDVFTISLKTTINRALRSMQAVARDIENARVSQVIYPIMQIVDIKHLGIDIVQAGLEQRKIHMLGAETFKQINYGTPVFVHTPLIPSLKGEGKMSSSEAESMITILDSDKDVEHKIKGAFCEQGNANNAVLSILQLVVFPRYNEVTIERPAKFGGTVAYKSYEQLEADFASKQLHSLDVKNTTAKYLNQVLKPIRQNFK